MAMRRPTTFGLITTKHHTVSFPRTPALILIFALLLAGLHFPAIAPAAQAAGASIYWGALVDGQAPTTDNMKPGGPFDTFEAHARKKMAIIHWGQPWMMNNGTWGEFQPSWFDNVRSHGSIPMINWGSWRLGGGDTQLDFQLRDIYEGKYDAYITRWATGAKNWKHPFFLRFNHEMNGWWFPWSEGKLSNGAIVNGNQSGDFVKAWRHVHGIFRSVGAANVTWVWCPNTIGDETPIDGLYPGDAYVDWTCLDGYNKGAAWQSFNTVFTGSGTTWLKNSYQLVLNAAPAKPMMLGEFASREDGDGGARKAAWLKDALEVQIPTNFPNIKAILYFNWDNNDGSQHPIETSQAATDAFAAAIGSSYYAGNQFATLATAPIPPLGGSSTTVALTAVADTYTDDSNPGSTAGGAATTLHSDASPLRKTFVKFDLAQLSGKTISSVKLRIKTTVDPYAGSANSHTVKLVNDVLWKEQYMSHTNTVAVSSTALGTLAANSAPNTWYEIPLTASVLQPRAGALLSIAIEASGADGLQIGARESAEKAQLVVIYQ